MPAGFKYNPLPPPATLAAQVPMHIICGSGTAVGDFIPDPLMLQGQVYSAPTAVINVSGSNAAPVGVYQCQIFAHDFTYTLPVLPGGPYLVRLHFAELLDGAKTRYENVTINGQQVLTNFDICATAGGQNIALVTDFPGIVPNANGNIVIEVASASTSPDKNAVLSGIEILPMSYHLQCEASKMLVGVAGGSASPGAAVQQNVDNGTAAQLWSFIPTSGGFYQIQNQNSLLDLAVSGTSTAAGAPIVQQTFGTQGNDQWSMVYNSDDSYSFFNLNSGRPLNDPGASTAAGTQFTQSTANGSAAQKFYMILPVNYHLQCEASKMLVGVAGGSTSPGAAVQQNVDNGTAAQVWTLIPISGGYYQIQEVNSGLDLAVAGASTAAGALIVQQAFGTQGNDQWSMVLNSDGSYSFFNRNSGRPLNDPGASTAAGTQFTQSTANGTPAQKFYMIQQ